MKLSKKKAKALYKAIHEPILNARLNIVSAKNGNMVYTPLAVDEKLHQLESTIWKRVCAVHGMDLDFITDEAD